jgi:hypothetical protein
MSFVNTPKHQLEPQPFKFLLELVPNPASVCSANQQLAQRDIINQIKLAGKDLFRPNPVVGFGSALKSKELWKKEVKISDLASAMEEYDLVMRVNMKSEDCNTPSVAVMATAANLRNNDVISSPSGAFSLVRHGNYIRGVDVA